MCDLFKELEGNEGDEGRGRGGRGKEYGVVVVAMEMTRNVPVPPGCPHRLIGPKPRPVPSIGCHRFQNPKYHLEYQSDW